jgi:hypothetical protein
MNQLEFKLRNFPYFNQLDNERNPYGSCNVTSVAMCLKYLGIVGNGDGQLEDQLYDFMIDKYLDRHSPIALQTLIKLKGRKDDFRPNAKWADAKKWLLSGKPLIAHGWFTRSGHIITIIGFNSKGWIVNDPYGEYFASGYDTEASGRELTYSYEMMKALCGNDGDLWLHFVG